LVYFTLLPWRPSFLGAQAPSREAVSFFFRHKRVASSRYLQNPFAIFICSGVWHSGSNSAGEHTNMLKALAREAATFNRFNLSREFMPGGASTLVEVVIE